MILARIKTTSAATISSEDFMKQQLELHDICHLHILAASAAAERYFSSSYFVS